MPPDQPRHSFRHPQGSRSMASMTTTAPGAVCCPTRCCAQSWSSSGVSVRSRRWTQSRMRPTAESMARWSLLRPIADISVDARCSCDLIRRQAMPSAKRAAAASSRSESSRHFSWGQPSASETSVSKSSENVVIFVVLLVVAVFCDDRKRRSRCDVLCEPQWGAHPNRHVAANPSKIQDDPRPTLRLW